MRGTHNTAVQKNVSEILETNSIAPNTLGISENLQPVINIEPKIDIFRTAFGYGETKTLYTTPTKADFFLTNITLACWGDTTGTSHGMLTLNITPKDTPATTFVIKNESTTTTPGSPTIVSIPFALRGLLIEKNSAITIDFDGEGSAALCGYIGSDRS